MGTIKSHAIPKAALIPWGIPRALASPGILNLVLAKDGSRPMGLVEANQRPLGAGDQSPNVTPQNSTGESKMDAGHSVIICLPPAWERWWYL